MSIEEFEVRGMKTYVHPMGPEAGLAYIAIRINNGSVHESPDGPAPPGSIHAVEHMLHLRPGELGTREALRTFDGQNGLRTNADTFYQRMLVYATGANPEIMMYRLGQVVFNVGFNNDPEGVGREIQAIRREAHTGRDDLDDLHSVANAYTLFGAPYGRRVLGHADRIDFSTEQLWKLYQQTHHLGNMSLIAVGAVDPEEIRGQIGRYFLDPPAHPHLEPQPLIKGRYAGQTTGLLRASSNARVSVLTPLGELTPQYHADPELYRVALGAVAVKIREVLRDKLGASYDGATYVLDHNMPHAWYIETRVTTDTTQTAINQVREAIAHVLELTPDTYPDTKILSARGTRAGGLLQATDGVSRRAASFTYHLDEGRKPHDLILEHKRVQALDPRDIRNAIADMLNHIDTHPSVTHITGPESAIKQADSLIDIQEIA